jgi:hypothetical protein
MVINYQKSSQLIEKHWKSIFSQLGQEVLISTDFLGFSMRF